MIGDARLKNRDFVKELKEYVKLHSTSDNPRIYSQANLGLIITFMLNKISDLEESKNKCNCSCKKEEV